jgi:hypothetical protein
MGDDPRNAIYAGRVTGSGSRIEDIALTPGLEILDPLSSVPELSVYATSLRIRYWIVGLRIPAR